MKNRTIFADFARYSSLNILGMLGLSCYILADTFFVSKGLGTDGLTALNLAIPIYSFIHGSGLMLGMGGATKYSILRSQGKAKKANQVFTNTALATLCLGAVFFILGLFFSDIITYWLGADASVYQMSKTYLRVILLFAPLFMLNNLLLCFVRNDGAPQLSMMAMIGGSLSNVLLDYVFIFPLRMGIFGAVLATGLAPVISMLILSPFFLRRRHRFRPVRCRVSRRILSGVVSCGIPSLITEVSSGVVMIVFNTILLRISGNTGVAAYGVIANLSLVVIAIYTGIAQGVQPLMSRQYGTGNQSNIRSVLRYAMISVLLVSTLIYALVFFGAPQIVSVFNSEQNPVLQSIATVGLKIYFTACAFAGLNIILSVFFTSTENPRPAHIISVLRGFVVVIPLAYLFAAIGGVTGVWAAFPATECLVCGVSLTLYALAHRRRGLRAARLGA